MSLDVGVGGAHKRAAMIWVGVGGAWKVVSRMDVGANSAWKFAFAPLEVSVSNVVGDEAGPSFTGISFGTASTTVLYGSGNYTYAWVHNSTSSGSTPTISSAAVQNPTFTATVSSTTPAVSSWTLTVTDVTYGITDTATITVTLTWEDTSGP